MDSLDKHSYKTLADAIGMPDKTDKENIQKIILKYEKQHPGDIKAMRDMARMHSKAGTNDFGLVNKDAGGRLIFELPPQLHATIEGYIPTIFREKKHFSWFCKNFKELMIGSKY